MRLSSSHTVSEGKFAHVRKAPGVRRRRARLVTGMNKLADAVRVTLGPKARTVVLERSYGSPSVVNSGVIVAKEIELEDRFENMGAQMVREVAAKTSEVAGDGTTTA